MSKEESTDNNSVVSKTVIPFKTKVKDCAISNAPHFKDNFIESEYAIFSNILPHDKKYCIVKGNSGNYLHLVGVNTSMPAEVFFRKCLNKTLADSDFDFEKRGVGSKALKGAVRDKIKVLNNMVNLFDGKEIMIQPDFKKNQIDCAIGSTDGECTLGFASSGHPKSLLKGNLLSADKSSAVDLILKRVSGEILFSQIVYQSTSLQDTYSETIKDIATDEVYKKLFKIEPINQ